MTPRRFHPVGLAVLLVAAGIAAPGAAQIRLNQAGGDYALRVVSYRDIPFRTVVRQQYDYSCGSAALATLLRHHYGRDVGEQQVFQQMFENGNQEAIQRVGFSLLDMKRFLESYGYQADGFRMTFDALAEAKAPAIVVVETNGYRHFVVVKGIADGRVLVGDPALGLKVYEAAEFEGMWNGVAFLISDAADRLHSDGEWRPFATPPMKDALPTDSLGALTRDLPPLYQITTRFSLDPYLR